MKYLSFFAMAALSISAYAQTPTSAAADSTLNSAASASARQDHVASSATEASSVSAALTKSIDTKNAHVGDQVFAKTTSAAVLTDGTRLPKGTKLDLVAVYDNSQTSPRQTAHPPRRVTFGEQTTDEMCFAFFGLGERYRDVTSLRGLCDTSEWR